jgi:hypothetical protein
MALSKPNCLLKAESRPAARRRPGHTVGVALPSAPGPYVLATGEAAAYRIRVKVEAGKKRDIHHHHHFNECPYNCRGDWI